MKRLLLRFQNLAKHHLCLTTTTTTSLMMNTSSLTLSQHPTAHALLLLQHLAQEINQKCLPLPYLLKRLLIATSASPRHCVFAKACPPCQQLIHPSLRHRHHLLNLP